MNDTKAKILGVMYDLMAEQGYEKTTTNQICELVGVKKPTLYYYFNTKEELLIEFVKWYMSDMSDGLLRLDFSNEQEFKSYLVNMGDEYIHHYCTNIKSKQVLSQIRILEKRIPAVKEAMDVVLNKSYEDIRRMIELGKSLGMIETNINLEATISLISIIFEGIDNMILHYSDFMPEQKLMEAWRQFVQLIVVKS